MSTTLDSTIRRRSDVRLRRVKDEWVVIRQQASEVLVLNEWAGRILDLLDGSRSLGNIVTILQEEYEADQQSVERDVLRFAAELVEAGLAESPSEVIR